MKNLAWILSFFLLFPSCKNGKPAVTDGNKLSVLIFSDSIITYNGVLTTSTPHKKFSAADSAGLEEHIVTNEKKYGDKLEVLLKMDGVSGVIDKLKFFRTLAAEHNRIHFQLEKATDADISVFKMAPMDWGQLIAEPISLDLKMPKDDQSVTEKPITNALSILLLKDSVIIYSGSAFSSARHYSYKPITVIKEKLEALLQKDSTASFIIKPTGESSYRQVVDILDMMTTIGARRYALLNPLPEELRFFNLPGDKPNQGSISPGYNEPAEIKTPESVLIKKVPDDNAFLVEIKNDKTIWYTVLMKDQENTPVKVSAPVSKNLSSAIRSFQQSYPGSNPVFLVKADASATYQDFEKVSDVFKQNKIYKYELVTSLSNK